MNDLKPEGWVDLIFGLALLVVSIGLAALFISLLVIAVRS